MAWGIFQSGQIELNKIELNMKRSNMLKKSMRNPWIGVFLSTIYPGLGHLYGGKKIKGFSIIFLFVVIYSIFFYIILNENTVIYQFYLFLLVPFYILDTYILIDSYFSVKKFNENHNVKFLQGYFKKITSVILIVVFFILVRNSLLGSFIKKNIVQAYNISSGTMAPTFLKNDKLLVKKNLFLKNYSPQRYDIIVFITPDGKDFIKRVIGLSGENIEIKDGKIFINGKLLDLPDEIKKTSFSNNGNYGEKNKIYKIPEDSYYVLGDSDVSKDSRYFGFISRSKIIGRAYKIYFPFNRAKKL